MPGTSVFLSRETGKSGNFVSRIKAVKYRFELKTARGTSLETPSPRGLHLAMTGEPRGFSRVAA